MDQRCREVPVKKCRTVQEHKCSKIKVTIDWLFREKEVDITLTGSYVGDQRKKCHQGQSLECEEDHVKSCEDTKHGYKGFTRKCEGVPLRRCHEVPNEHCDTVEDTKCELVPVQECHNVNTFECYQVPDEVRMLLLLIHWMERNRTP